MEELANIFKIKEYASSQYGPASNAATHRDMFIVTNYRKHFISEYTDNWDTFLPYAALFHNILANPKTNLTPYQLVFGRKTLSPPEFVRPTDLGSHATDLHRNFQIIKKIAEDHLKGK